MRDLQCTLNLDSNVRKTSIMVAKGTCTRTVMYDLTHIMDNLSMVVKSYITLSLMHTHALTRLISCGRSPRGTNLFLQLVLQSTERE